MVDGVNVVGAEELDPLDPLPPQAAMARPLPNTHNAPRKRLALPQGFSKRDNCIDMSPCNGRAPNPTLPRMWGREYPWALSARATRYYYYLTAQIFAWLASGPTCAGVVTSLDCFSV